MTLSDWKVKDLKKGSEKTDKGFPSLSDSVGICSTMMLLSFFLYSLKKACGGKKRLERYTPGN